jgi:hypothetical protein
MLKDEQWGPWVRHFGQGMPVQAGTIVEVTTYEAVNPNKGEVIGRVGVAGVDLVKSWSWKPETRSKNPTKSLPIDLYRIKRPRGMEVLQELLKEIPQPELEVRPQHV